jgi:hypothetical protein
MSIWIDGGPLILQWVIFSFSRYYCTFNLLSFHKTQNTHDLQYTKYNLQKYKKSWLFFSIPTYYCMCYFCMHV